MIQKILAALITALAFVTGQKEAQANLKSEIADRDNTIAGLQKALADENANDASLQAAADAAKAAQAEAEKRYADLLATLDEAGAKADELTASITADPAIPVNVATDGTVTQTGDVPADAAPQS